jgi:hypothetical protein
MKNIISTYNKNFFLNLIIVIFLYNRLTLRMDIFISISNLVFNIMALLVNII